MSGQFVGMIQIFPYTSFIPKGWALCDGTALPIAENTALFSVIGTTYGGDGTSTFALPDLRGAVAIGQGTASSGTLYKLGELSGDENVMLTLDQLPSHTHIPHCASESSTQNPTGAVWGRAESTMSPIYGISMSNLTPMHPSAIAPAGGGSYHNNMMPTLGMMFYICVNGHVPPPGPHHG